MDCSTPGFHVHQQLRSLLKLISIELVMPSNHLILCCPLLLLPSVFPSIKVFSHEWVLYIRWPNYWSFSFSISPSNEYSEWIFFRMDWLDLLAVQETLKSLLQHHSWKASVLRHSTFFIFYSSTLTSIPVQFQFSLLSVRLFVTPSIHDYWKNHSFDWMDLCQQRKLVNKWLEWNQ